MACQRIHARTTDPSARPGEDIHVTTQRSRAQRLRANPDAPDLWCGASPLVDLEDPKLRVRAQSLVQTRSSDAEKAQAVYTFVRRLPVRAAAKLRLRTARQVLERGHGDAIDKATLLIALMRLAGLPARVRFAPASREALRGLPADVSSMPRPFVEVWVGGRWMCTDTYIFDSAYIAAARQRLRRERREYGYGIHAEGASLWESHRDAYLLGPDAADALLAGSERAWRDPQEFAWALPALQRLAQLGRLACWNLATPWLEGALATIRAEAQPRQRAGRKGPETRGGTLPGATQPPASRASELLASVNSTALWP